jgi:glycosyltransferase involved in cell wall biosynthesis
MIISDKTICVLVMYGYALGDPPARQAATSLAQHGCEVHIIQIDTGQPPEIVELNVLTIHNIKLPEWLKKLGPFYNWYRWRHFVQKVRQLLDAIRPQLAVTIMLHALSALPRKNKGFKLLSCIYDIPTLEDAGKLDRRIIQRGWQRLKSADLVWASDSFKADLAQERGQLDIAPRICHNCPPLNYLPEPTWPRDGWLRDELLQRGARIGKIGGSILLRAGAVGECGGIEETLAGMRALPKDFIFVMLGRPSETYKRQLQQQIVDLGLQRQAFLFDRPTDKTWKQALQGADIGHLIHGPFPPGRMSRLYGLNSSLSNNRLFQYMAAGLPIIAYDDARMTAIYEEVSCFKVTRLTNLQVDHLTAWRQLAESSQMRKELGMAGRRAHLAKYNWEHQFSIVFKEFKS